MKKIQPLGDKVVIIKHPKNDQIDGFYLGENADTPDTGDVVSVGNDVNNDRSEIQINKDDTVIFPRNAGVTVSLEGKEFLVLAKSQLIGKVVLDEDL